MFSFLDGYKTKIGGVAGLCGAFYMAWNGDYPHAWAVFSVAMVALGLGGKLQKIVDASAETSGTVK